MTSGKVCKDSKCVVAIGYDVDMPGDLRYLYNRNIGWRGGCHGHLNEDVSNYIEKLVEIAEDYNAKLQFFLQGNTLEDPIDMWVEIVKKGHAIDQHTYSHISLIDSPIDQIESEIVKTKNLLEKKLKITNIGLRGPGGYTFGLKNREDVQRIILKTGIKFVSTQNAYFPSGKHPLFTPSTEEQSIKIIAYLQPYYYKTGLLEIPFCCYQDRQYFDIDMGGNPEKPVEAWIKYLKRAIDFVYNRGLFLSLTLHPSTSFKHDRDAKYLREILSYCQQRGIPVCTYRDIYNLVARSRSAYRNKLI